MAKRLYEHIKDYGKAMYPMHMPGHKMGRIGKLDNLYDIDVTEVKGTDNLHDPEDIIKEAQEQAANLFGAYKSYFLINGSTVGLMAAITATCKEGDTLLVARNCHRSVYDGLITAGVQPIYIQPAVHRQEGIVGGIDSGSLDKALRDHPEAVGLVMTSPTYEGFTSNIKDIAKILHDESKILIIDEAHGAHFIMHEELPMTALEQGADIVVQSLHKTLPALTQSALLHIGNNAKCIQPWAIQSALRLYETSSPSYVLMCSIDHCCHWMAMEGKESFKSYMNDLKETRLKLQNLKHLRLINEKDMQGHNIYELDPTKIVISTLGTGVTGTWLQEELRSYHIELEMATLNTALAMTTVADDEGLQMLVDALLAIDSELKTQLVFDDNKGIKPLNIEIAMSPRKAYFSPKTWVTPQDCIGKISGDYLIPYPPGIPLVTPGEIITKEIIEQINNCLQNHIHISGLDSIKIIQDERG